MANDDRLALLNERGVAAPSGKPLVQTLSIHDDEFQRRVLGRAARRLLEVILRAELSGISFDQFVLDKKHALREIRTSVDSARTIPRIVGETSWGSSGHNSAVKRLVMDKEQGPAAALLLLHEPLFAWARKLVVTQPSDDAPLYQHLHMLARVQVNLELAAACSDVAGAGIHYAPAYSRAAAIAQNYYPRSVANLHFLQSQLWEVFLAYTADVPQGVTLPIPIVGAAILLSLPEQPTLTNLIDAVVEVRNSDVGIALRDLVSQRRTAIGIIAVMNALTKKLKLPTSVGSSLKARTTIMTTPPFSKLELVSEKDLTRYANVSPRDVMSYLYSKPDVVVLTAFLEELFAMDFPLGDMMARTRHLLCLAA